MPGKENDKIRGFPGSVGTVKSKKTESCQLNAFQHKPFICGHLYIKTVRLPTGIHVGYEIKGPYY